MKTGKHAKLGDKMLKNDKNIAVQSLEVLHIFVRTVNITTFWAESGFKNFRHVVQKYGKFENFTRLYFNNFDRLFLDMVIDLISFSCQHTILFKVGPRNKWVIKDKHKYLGFDITFFSVEQIANSLI